MTEKELHNYYRKYLQTTEGIHLNTIEKLNIKKFLTFIINENEVVQRERLNEETTNKCYICDKQYKEDDILNICHDCLHDIQK